MTTREDVVAAARTWISTPWIHQHRKKGIGADCLGLIVGAAQEVGIESPLFDIVDYRRQPTGALLPTCREYLREVSQKKMQPGDILVIAIDKEPQHAGLVGDYVHGGLSLIHSVSTGGRGVVETRLVFARNLKFVAAFAMPGIEE